MEHGRFSYSAISKRPKYNLPNGARVAIWVIPNIEHFHYGKPSTSLTNFTTQFSPDILNYSWRDYGARVGTFRMMELMDKHGIPGTAALNSDACAAYPEIIEAGQSLGWEWMGHGTSNSQLLAGLDEDAERKLIREVVDTIRTSTGSAPRGWLSPALTETHRTPDLLAEAGIDYLADWVNDDQPYRMNVRAGSLYAIPYSMEINDVPAFVEQHMTGEEFARMIIDQFDVLYEEGAETGRVMSIALHAFLVGHPHRSRHLETAFRHIRSRQDVWLATGSEIIDFHKAHNEDAIRETA